MCTYWQYTYSDSVMNANFLDYRTDIYCYISTADTTSSFMLYMISYTNFQRWISLGETENREIDVHPAVHSQIR